VNADLDKIVEVDNTLGESIIWDGRREEALWCDIEGKRLFRHSPAGDVTTELALPSRPAAIGLCEDSQLLVTALENEIGLLHLETGRWETLWQPALAPGVRFNDGRVGPDGALWITTMDEVEHLPKGGIFRVDPHGHAEQIFDGISIGNGLAWAADGSAFYFADSATALIYRCGRNPETGSLGSRTDFATGPGIPDGATVDAQGGLWSARWGAGCLLRYDSYGNKTSRLDIPCRQPTCVAFGGPRYNLLFVSSARPRLAEDALPADGSMFVLRTTHRGLPEPVFKSGNPIDRPL